MAHCTFARPSDSAIAQINGQSEYHAIPGRDQHALTDVAARSLTALACAESGSEGEALRIALDIDEVIYEVKMLHGAVWLMGRK